MSAVSNKKISISELITLAATYYSNDYTEDEIIEILKDTHNVNEKDISVVLLGSFVLRKGLKDTAFYIGSKNQIKEISISN